MEPAQGDYWPKGRSSHAACCLNYGEDHLMVVVFGGLDERSKVLGDTWILDVDSGKWTEVRITSAIRIVSSSKSKELAVNQNFTM